MNKNLFVEPDVELVKFAAMDSALFLSGFETGDEDELDPAYGNTPVYG